jgi:hypothetical protein
MEGRRRPAGIWIIVVVELVNAVLTLVDRLTGLDVVNSGAQRLGIDSEALRWVAVAWAVLVVVAALSLWLLHRRGWVLMMVLVGGALAANLVVWWLDAEATNWVRLTLNIVVAFYLNSAQVRDLFLARHEVSRIALSGRAKS